MESNLKTYNWILKVIKSCINVKHCDGVIILLNQYNKLYPNNVLTVFLVYELETKINQINKS